MTRGSFHSLTSSTNFSILPTLIARKPIKNRSNQLKSCLNWFTNRAICEIIHELPPFQLLMEIFAMPDRWLSVEEIAEYLGVSKDTVYAWISKRHMPSHRIGRLWKFKSDEVDVWVRSGGAAEVEGLVKNI